MNNINLNVKLLKNASLCIGNDEVRYYLNGVFIKDNEDGTRDYVSTNGHIMYIGNEKINGDKLDKPIILKGDWKYIYKKLINENYYNFLKVENYFVLGEQFILKEIEGEFPEYKRVFPKKLKPLKYYREFDNKYIKIVQNILKDYKVLSGDKNFNDVGPVVFQEDNEIVVLMPKRG